MLSEFAFISVPKNEKAVIKLLQDSGKWETYHDSNDSLIKKYSILKRYKDTKSLSCKIATILPFNPEVHYEENLIDDDTLDAEFKRKNITVISDISFISFLKGHTGRELTPDDMIFSSLYKVKTYIKN